MTGITDALSLRRNQYELDSLKAQSSQSLKVSTGNNKKLSLPDPALRSKLWTLSRLHISFPSQRLETVVNPIKNIAKNDSLISRQIHSTEQEWILTTESFPEYLYLSKFPHL